MTQLTIMALPQVPHTDDIELARWTADITQYLNDLNHKSQEIYFNRSEILEKSDTGTANTEFSLQHHLARLPLYYILVWADKAAQLYNGTTTWTNNTIYLKCNVANAHVKILVT